MSSYVISLSELYGYIPGCVAALRAFGNLLTFDMIPFQDLSTFTNILDSAGSCLLMSGAKKILSRYSQFLWHVSHSSWKKGTQEEKEGRKGDKEINNTHKQ